ncbi:hypothetical protein ABG768_018478 [Culter alburnus]|uniref:Uncharacterized protein n=1 Tax=Culter alburnus TaxID=194366 RepID=A0AAW1YXB3_CULAL
MVLTYASQRSAINSRPSLSVDELKREWPFLFMKKFLMQHFTSLTGIELYERLRECIAGKGRRVLQFFKTQLLRWTKEVKTVLADIERLQGENMDSTIAVILLMMTFFKEKDDAIFLLADRFHPDIKKWMLCVEGKVVIQSVNPQDDFTSALAVFFASFYIFNLEYQAEAASTLEFIQRFLVRINPENTKCKAKFQQSHNSGRMVQRRNRALNSHVASFIKEFTNYDWLNY